MAPNVRDPRRRRPVWRPVRALLAAAAFLVAGCGLGAGEEQEGGAELRVTRDFGHEELGSARLDTLREDQTVMRMLRSEFDVDTRFGGRFVQSIDGLRGRRLGRHDRLVLLRQRHRVRHRRGRIRAVAR